MTILMNELTLVAVMKYRLPPTTNTCKARKCGARGQLLKVPHNTNRETVSEKNRKTVGVVCRQFDRLSQHHWQLSETTKQARALEL